MRSLLCIIGLMAALPLTAQKWERMEERFEARVEAGDYYRAGKEAADQVNYSLENLDSTDLRYMLSYYNLALAYHGLQNLDQAKAYLTVAYNLMAPFYTLHGAEFIDVCELFGRIETGLGYHETAGKFLDYVRDASAQLYGTNSYEYVQALYYIAELEMAREAWDSMVEVLVEALGIHERYFTKNNDFARYANFLGLVYLNNGHHTLAAESFERALSAYEDPEVERGFPYAHTSNNLGLTYYYLSDFGKAAYYFEQADSLYPLLLDGPSENYLMLLNNLASLYYSWGKPEKAREAYQRLEAYMKGFPGSGSLVYIQAVENAANYYAEAGELKRSERYYREAVALRAAADPYDAREHAGGILLLASLYAEKDRPDLAAETAVEAYLILKKECPPGDPDLVLALSILGLDFYNAELYNQSMYYYREAREQIEGSSGPVSPEAAAVYNNLGTLYYNQNMLGEAVPCLEKAHELNPEDPVTLTNLGMTYFLLENRPMAGSMFDEAKRLYAKKYGTDHMEYATSLANVAGMKMALQDFSQELLGEIREVERICLESGADTTGQLYIECMGLYRSYYLGTRDYERSLSYGKRAQELEALTHGKNSAEYAQVLLLQTDSYMKLMDRERLDDIFSEADRIIQRVDGEAQEELRYMLESRKAACYYYLQDYPLARHSLEWVVERDKKQYLESQYILSSRERANFTSKLTSLVDYNNYIKLYPDDPDIAVNALENRIFIKSIQMDSERRQREALSATRDTALVALHREHLAARASLANLRSEFGVDRRVLDSMERRIEEMETEISRRLGEEMAMEDRYVHWEQIRDALAGDEAAVEVIQFYHRTPPPRVTDHPWYIAFVITREMQDAPLYIDLFDAMEVVPDYNQYREAVESPSGGPLDEGLYDRFWSKIDRVIEGKRTVYFSPDNLYHYVNVEALRDRDGRWIMDKYEIRYVSNLAHLLQEDREYGSNHFALLAGDPQFRMSLASIPDPEPRESSRAVSEFQSRMFPGARLSALPGTLAEVDTIGSMLLASGWECTLLTGREATEDAVVSAGSPRVLHLATHGFFAQDEQAGDSVATGTRYYKYMSSEADRRSCLFFAGAQNTLFYAYDYQEGSGDGILTAWEIEGMNLDSTELVVLSACETGLGDVLKSGGVTGLRRAFHLAGAERIMLSLWEVDDQATQLLMREFYANWLSGMDMDRALSEAKRYLREDPRFAHPRYWAGFILSGS